MNIKNSVLDPSLYFELNIQEIGREACVKGKKFDYTPKSYHLFHYIMDGEGTLEYKGKTYKLKPGQMFYIAPNDKPIYSPNPDNPWTYIWVGFDGLVVKELLATSHISASNPIYVDISKDVRTLFIEMHASRRTEKANTLYALSSLYRLFSIITYDNAKNRNNPNLPLIIIEAREFILNNFQFNISIDDIASSISVTPNYLSNQFKKHLGITIKKYINGIRIERACALLTFTDLPIKEVAKRVSFDNQLQFATLFKKYRDVTPSEYRKNLK